MLGLRFCILFAHLFEFFFSCCCLHSIFKRFFLDLGSQRGACWGPFSQILQILHGKTHVEIEARTLMTFGRLLGGAGGRGQGLPDTSDSAEHGGWVESPPAPPARVRRILWAAPSAAGPRPVLIDLGLEILGIVASGS